LTTIPAVFPTLVALPPTKPDDVDGCGVPGSIIAPSCDLDAPNPFDGNIGVGAKAEGVGVVTGTVAGKGEKEGWNNASGGAADREDVGVIESKRPARLSTPLPASGPAGGAGSSKSINEMLLLFCREDGGPYSAGIGLDEATKSPFLNASYRASTVFIWSLVCRKMSTEQ
jgi:hypothetical protein